VNESRLARFYITIHEQEIKLPQQLSTTVTSATVRHSTANGKLNSLLPLGTVARGQILFTLVTDTKNNDHNLSGAVLGICFP
jgi:hypothetical protein